MTDGLRGTLRGLLWACVAAVLVCAATGAGTGADADTHTEDLLLQVLPEGLLNAVFVFNTTGAGGAAHHRALPHALAALMRTHGVADLAVSLTHGRWRTDAWGYAPLATEAPPGALLALTLAPGPHAQPPAARVAGARRAVAALLCTALDTADLAPAPDTDTDADDAAAPGPYRGALPLETVCTENLAPWLQLLPCRDRAGVGALLHPRRLYGLPYHSLALRATQSAAGVVTAVQTLALVTRRPPSATSTQPQRSPLLRLDDVFELAHAGEDGNAAAGAAIALRACPVAQASHVTVALPPGAAPDSVRPAAGRTVLPGARGVRYTLPRSSRRNGSEEEEEEEEGLVLEIDTGALDGRQGGGQEQQQGEERGPLVSAHQFVTGYGQVSGGLVLEARSRAAVPVRVRVAQTLPCYLRPYLAARRATLDGAPAAVRTAVHHRARAGALHARVDAVAVTAATLPPRAVLRLELYFEMALLPIPEQPPEAERGRDLPAAVVDVAVPLSPSLNSNSSSESDKEAAEAAMAAALFGPFAGVRRAVVDGEAVLVHTQYTEGLLVATPWPDFSMPYNVVCLTVTVFGLFFGWVVVRLLRHYGDLYDRATGTFRPAPKPAARIVALATRPLVRLAALVRQRRPRRCMQQKEDDEKKEQVGAVRE